MQIKKVVAFALALCLSVSLFTSCKKNEQDGTQGSSSQSSEGNQPKVHKLKIMGTEGWKPTVFKEREDQSAWKILDSWFKEANLEIEWEVLTTEQYDVILKTRLASGNDLPDIVKAHTMDNAAILALAKQGIVQPINPIIDQYSNGNIKKMYTETFKNVLPLNTAPDGKMYWFSNVQTKYYADSNNVDGTFAINYRKDWADKLGIKEPTNINEFRQMLLDFRTKDVNKSGKPDEVIFVDLGKYGAFRNCIAQWFDLAIDTIAIDPYNKKAVTPWKNPNVKEYFKYMNQLVKDGIIDPALSGNYEMMAQKMAENKIAAIWDYSNAGWNEPQVAKVAPDVLFAPLMPLQAIEGVVPAGMAEPGALVWEKYVVTKQCKDLEGVAKLFDIIHTDKYANLTAFGQEGKNYKLVDGVITHFEGKTGDTNWAEKISEGASIWNGVLPRVQMVDMREQVATCDELKKKVTLDMLKYPKRYPDQINNFLAIPTDEEIEVINSLRVNVDTASKELATKLALGRISIDQLDAEVKKLDDMGLDKLLKITQARYDRYLANMPK